MACYFKNHQQVTQKRLVLQSLRKEAENSDDALAKTFSKALFENN